MAKATTIQEETEAFAKFTERSYVISNKEYKLERVQWLLKLYSELVTTLVKSVNGSYDRVDLVAATVESKEEMSHGAFRVKRRRMITTGHYSIETSAPLWHERSPYFDTEKKNLTFRLDLAQAIKEGLADMAAVLRSEVYGYPFSSEDLCPKVSLLLSGDYEHVIADIKDELAEDVVDTPYPNRVGRHRILPIREHKDLLFLIQEALEARMANVVKAP